MTLTASTDPSVTDIARAMLGDLENAWNSGDGQAYGRCYAVDASFVTIRGEHSLDRDAIAAGHAAIFATIYAGSSNQMELLTSWAVADDVIIAVSRNTLTSPGGPLRGTHEAVSTSVLVRNDGDWAIAATHNTLAVPQGPSRPPSSDRS